MCKNRVNRSKIKVFERRKLQHFYTHTHTHTKERTVAPRSSIRFCFQTGRNYKRPAANDLYTNQKEKN